jgi:hypothetical protein
VEAGEEPAITSWPCGAGATASGARSESMPPPAARAADGLPGTSSRPIVETSVLAPPGQVVAPLHTTAPPPVACAGLSRGNTARAGPAAAQSPNLAGADHDPAPALALAEAGDASARRSVGAPAARGACEPSAPSAATAASAGRSLAKLRSPA